jgi:hypothetical protein
LFFIRDAGLKNMQTDASPKQLFGFLLIFFLPCWLCIIPVTVDILRNNYDLGVFADNLYKYPLPPQSKVVSTRAEVGLLLGNGNYCAFVAEQAVASQLSYEQIKSYYRAVRFANARNEPGTFATTVVSISETCSVKDFSCFIIVLEDMDDDPGFDYRCH